MATTSPSGGSSTARRATAVAALAIAVGIVLYAGALMSGALGGVRATPVPVTAVASPTADQSAAPSPSTSAPGATSAPTPSTPPAVVLVPAPLTGRLVTQDAATRHPIAVMVDDHIGARPQAGFNAASVVWQAPAEGGIPRYMLIFQDKVPTSVGPVRSAREYFIEWAAEWRSMYVHAGGSPQALTTLRATGNARLVINADDFVWEGRYLWRVTFRIAPHNVFTDGAHLEALAKRLGAVNGPIKPAWSFQPNTISATRREGARIVVIYPYEKITYRYDAFTNTYPRYINSSKTPQVDMADGKVVAPTNVVILRMFFGPLNGLPTHGRLEASNIGSGQAWISTGGVTIKGTWRKASKTAPTLLFGPNGQPVVLTAGQTFVQVLPLTYPFQITAGHAVGPVEVLSRTQILAN